MALLEMGSTGFRLVIDTGRYTERRSQHLHLGSSVSTHGSFTEDDIAAATRLATEFMTAARMHNCQRIVSVATESFRLAANGDAVAAHIGREIGCPVQILSPQEEVALAWRSVINEFPHLPDITMVDFSGGSLALGSGLVGPKGPSHNFSYPLGTSVLAPRALSDGYLETSMRIRLEHHIAETLKPVVKNLETAAHQQVVLTGGMGRAIARLIHTTRRGEVPDHLHGLNVDCSDLGHLVKKFSELSLAARLALPGMDQRRSLHMPLAVAIIRQTMRSLEAHAAVVATGGLREGLLAQLMTQQTAA